MVNQIAVFLENKKGRMCDCCTVLSDAGINLQSMTVADTKDFGILRITTNNNAKALDALKKAGFLVTSNDLIGIEMPDRVGALADTLSKLDEFDVNIEYLYSSVTTNGKAQIIFKTSSVEKATKALDSLGVKYL